MARPGTHSDVHRFSGDLPAEQKNRTMKYWGPPMGGGVLAVTAVMLVVAGLTVAAVVLLVRYASGTPAPTHVLPRHDPAEEILAERYAHSDIDDAEYQRRLALLRSARHR